MDARLGVVDIAIILSPICLPLPSFHSVRGDGSCDLNQFPAVSAKICLKN